MRIRMRFHAILLTLAALVPIGGVALAQNIGSLRGTVTDPSNAVIPNATVVATGNGTSRTATSDAQGKFAMPNLPPGKYTVRADAAGFVTFSKADVDVATGQGSSLDIALQIA